LTIDLAFMEAIDVHVHAEIGRGGEDGLRPEWATPLVPVVGQGGSRSPSTSSRSTSTAPGGRRGVLPPELVRYANTALRDRVLFGSDYPLITPDRWLADFAEADFRAEVQPLVLKENAARMLGLAG
jgi:hypothetical protein